MRARPVNENQRFQRGRDTKTALDVGGVNLADEHENRLIELKMEIDNEKKLADESWREYLDSLLVGKTITARMTQIRIFTRLGKDKSANTEMAKGELTIQVKDVHPGENFAEAIDRDYAIPAIIVSDTENRVYSVPLNQKIRIG